MKDMEITHIDSDIERTFQLRHKPGVGYQWRYDDGESRSPVFQTRLEAEFWMRLEHGELQRPR